MKRRTVFRMFGLTALAAGAAGLAGCAGLDAPPEPEGAVRPGAYRLGPGDALRVIVFGEETLSGEFRVDGSGAVGMPLIGNVPAGGLTTRELEQRIAERLSQGYVTNPRVSVEVLTFRPFFILGEVRTPGQYPYVDNMTALSAIAIAGGYTYRAQENYVLVTRGADPEKKVYRAPVTTPVLPGDVVRVPERSF